ncbi:MAG: hypothetical protein QNJ31_08685 [Candidatus Caenarcaniphilales bacterium]|nr:hypothetical protein [Candidatus Caenarcaniphilales bacterium]
MSQQTTLSKITELFNTESSFESIEYIIKGARYIQKSLDLLGLNHELPESKMVEVSKKFYQQGVQVEGDLIFPSGYDNNSSENLNVDNVNSFSNPVKV